jgi:hypothetical protein
MKVLIVSFRAPPYNSPGAVRSLGTASELLRLGADVRVIAAADQGLPATLDPGPIGSSLRLVGWWDVNAPLNILAGGKNQLLRISDATLDDSIRGRVGLIAKKAYQSVVHIPDGQIGWVGAAVRDALKLAEEWRPDVVLGSALPISSLYAARAIATKLAIPWVAEFRDLWTDNHYYTLPAWRRAIDRVLEKRLLRTASALVTISSGLAEVLRRQVSVPVEIIYNGIDGEAPVTEPPPPSPADSGLDRVHTGQLIPGKRDPQVDLEALASLGNEAAGISLAFYGRRLDIVGKELQRFPSRATILTHEPVSREEALGLQRAADVLLLLLWNHPHERGVVPSKFFEYLGAGRPILLVGPVNGDAATILRECQAGFTADNASDVARILTQLRMDKFNGAVSRQSATKVATYRRSNQVRKLLDILRRVAVNGE